MRLGEKIPVPQLSANQSARLQQRVLAHVAAQPEIESGWFGNRLRFAVAAVAVAGVALAVAINVKGAIEGQGSVVAGNTAEVTELATGADAVTVKLGDAVVTLAPRTAASIIRRPTGSIDIALDRGRVDCEVEPIAGRAPFRVGADDVEVEVVGTVFAVELAAEVQVEVDRGVVAVRSPAGEFRVEAGKMWTASGGVVAMVAMADADAGDAGGPSSGARDDAGELILDEPRDAGDASDPDNPDNSHDPGAHTRAADGPRHSKRAGKRSLQKHRGRPLGKNAPPRHSAPDDPRLLAAMELESDDPRAATREYRRIAAKNRGRIASFALYSKAYVEYFKLGDKRQAVETLDFFKRRFPRAREAQSALWLRVLALCGLGRTGECRAAAYSYIRRFPGGKFVDAATEVVNRD